MAERGRPRGFDRDAALGRAMEVFWARGYEATSMTDLTRAMEIGSPSLYAAFGSKEALFREAVDHYLARQGTAIWGALESASTVRTAIEHFLMDTARAYSTSGDPAGCFIVLGAIHGSGEDDPVHGFLRALRKDNRSALEARFARAAAEGELPPGFDCAGAAAFYLSLQTGMSILARDGATAEELHAAAQGGIAAWDGLLAR